MSAHDTILRQIQEAKSAGAKDKITQAAKLLREAAADLEGQERMDLTSSILDIEDVIERVSPS